MKVLFLDIDGVMNSVRGKGPFISDMEEEKLLRLAALIREGGARGIVLTSDRRTSPFDLRSKTEALAQFGITLLGVTRDPLEDEDDSRGRQILDYLESSEEDIERIVILDDNDDGISPLFYEDFVLINRYYGLREEDKARALNRLSGA